DEEPRFVSAHAQAVGNVLGKGGVRSCLDLDPLIADEGGDRAFEDVEGLVLACVDVDRRLIAGSYAPFDDGPVATRFLAGELELGARAMTGGNGAARARTGQDGVAEGHLTFPFALKVSKPTCAFHRRC